MSKITVLKSTKTMAEKGYPIVELAYKTEDGKTKGMKIFGFGQQKANADVAGSAKSGDVLEATFQQNQKGFWEFKSLAATGETSNAVSSGTGGTTSGSTGTSRTSWETAEERAARQILIVRQSSLSTAVSFAEVSKTKPSVEEVIEIAKKFEAYVMGQKVTQTGDVE
jgi:hypothetical protein